MADQAEFRRLKKEISELRCANEILRTASAFSQAVPRPSHDEMIRYVGSCRDQFGGERICRVLGVTAGGFMTSRVYRAARTHPMSHRAIRDQVLGEEIERLHADNYGVYGVRKVYYRMRRQG